MNFNEGMRRLALLVGVLGATLGGFASYTDLREAIGARARHKAFEALATSDVVQQERTSWVLARLPQGQYTLSDIDPGATPASSEATKGDINTTHGPWEKYQQTDIVTTWESFSPGRREELLAKMTPEQKHKLRSVIEQQKKQGERDPYAEFQKPLSTADPFAAIAKPFSEVNKGGIKTINWTRDLGVESIETADGATLYPTPAPTLWPYLMAAIFPVLGFVVPWCSVRALAWVGVGFFEKSK